MLHSASVTCYPPLGQATSIPYTKSTVKFIILIESSANSIPTQDWEVSLWHNGHEQREWRELSAQDVTEDVQPLEVRSKSSPAGQRRYFSASISRPNGGQFPVHFTLKYRLAPNQHWRWANETQHQKDGQICFQPKTVSKDLADYLHHSSTALNVRPESSEAPGAILWSATATVKAANGDASGWTGTNLGTPKNYTRWFCLVRPWTPWIAPRHGETPFDCENGSMVASFERHDGTVLVIFALSGLSQVLTELKPDGRGNVIAESRNDREETGTTNLLIAVAPTFEIANSACVYHARKLVRGYEDLSKDLQQRMEICDEFVKTESVVDWHDGLTYCTWNSLGQGLSEDKIFDALDDLSKHDIKVTNLIIDDNWQSLNVIDSPNQWDKGWSQFEANKKHFPHGLGYLTAKIRQQHKNVRHIAVWHALLGYWGGLDPKGQIAKTYKTRTVPKNGGGEMTVVDDEDLDRMYTDFYDFLLSSGVDGVKTDAQFYLDEMSAAPDRRRFMNAVQDAWGIAALRHFGIQAISCMSCFPQNICHSMLPTNKPRFMIRNSDDFQPDNYGGHPWHVFVNAHNALLTQHLNVIPDWDMFQTKNHYSAFHAAARCISGGPVYITDYPGQHDLDLIDEFSAPTSHGQTVVLRPSTLGKTVDCFIGYDDYRLLKVSGWHGGSDGTSLFATFNLRQRPITDLIHLSEFAGIAADKDYVVRAHTTGEISRPLSLASNAPVVALDVPVQGYEILSAYPLRSFKLESALLSSDDNTRIAVLGLLGKMTGAAAVNSTEYLVQGGRLRVRISIKALGVLGIFVSNINDIKLKDRLIITIQGKVIPFHTVTVSEDNPVLEVDVKTAYKELGLSPLYSNDVGVDVYFQ